MGQPLEVQILSSAAKQAREFKQPEAKIDWARGGCEGAKSSLAPTGVRGKRSEASERFHLPVAINDWARGGCAGAKIYRATTRASDPSDTGGLIEGGNGSEEALGVRVGGVGSDGFRWALLNKFAMFKDGDLIADVFYDG